MADIMENILYPTKDPGWIMKFLISYVAFIPLVGGLLISGYELRVLKENAREDKHTLPEWDNLGGLFMDGLMIFIIRFLYMLIPFILIVAAYLPMIVSLIVSAGFASSDSETLKTISGITALGGSVIFIILMIVAIIVTFVMAFLLPMALGIYASTGSIFSALNPFTVIGKVLYNFVSYIVIFLVTFVLGFIMAIAGLITGGILMPPAVFYILTVQSKMMGDLLRRNSM
jgi:hypothetical protein